MKICISETRDEMGSRAALDIAHELRRRLEAQQYVRIIFAAAPSQREMLQHLLAQPGIDWTRIVAFHMDEYVGLPNDAPQRFALWLREAIFDRVPLAAAHLLNPGSNAEAECRRYAGLLEEAPIDVVLCGVGENGHLAFNDPPADMTDSRVVKLVELDHACRQQQVNDGCFAALGQVPTHALTLTIPALLGASRIYCVVPGERKRGAVNRMMRDPVNGDCPATALRGHACCSLYVDWAAGADLPTQ